jgi:flagellar assembly factor FliW
MSAPTMTAPSTGARPTEEHMTAQPAEALPTIEFVAPMPGFAGLTTFVLVRVDDSGPLYALTSLDQPDLRFLVIAPGAFFPEYAPEIDDETLDLLGGVSDPEQLLVLLVVTVSNGLADATANLMAPVIVDQGSRRAVQVVLAGSGLPVRAPLVEA